MLTWRSVAPLSPLLRRSSLTRGGLYDETSPISFADYLPNSYLPSALEDDERDDLETALSLSIERAPVAVPPTLVVDENMTDGGVVKFAPPRLSIGQTWLQSCGDIDPGTRIPSPDGSPLSLHSVDRLALRAGGVSGRAFRLPPGEASGEGVMFVGVLGSITSPSYHIVAGRQTVQTVE